MNYRYVFLDADNTLLDFDRSEDCALGDALAYGGLADTPALRAQYRRINRSWWERLERAEVTRGEVLVGRWREYLAFCGASGVPEEINAYYLERLGSYSFTLPGAAELCAELRRRGHVLALLTNGNVDVQRRRWGISPAAPFVEHVFVSGNVGYEKPDRRFFDHVLTALGAERAQCLMVGDSETSDMRGGVNAGIDTCWYNPAGAPAHGAWTYEIRTLDALLDIV